MRVRLAFCFVLIAGSLLMGCRVSKTRRLATGQVFLKAETTTKAALLDTLKKQSLEIKTLMVTKSSLKASHILSGAAIKDYTDVGGTIVVDRPGNLFLEVEKLNLTIADMVADEKQYKVFIPHKKQGTYGVGEIGDPPETVEFPYSLRPSHILDALFVDGEQFIEVPGIATVMTETTGLQADGVHSYYLIAFNKGEIPLEQLWVDRSGNGMQVTRKITYKEDGRVEADISYSNYDKFGDIQFPKTVVINRRNEDYSLEMKFEKLELNTPIDPSAFDLPRPAGAKDFDVNTGKLIERP